MTASRLDRKRGAAAAVLLSLLGVAGMAGLAGCRSAGGLPAVSAFEPLPARSAPVPPDELDAAVHDVAAAALAGSHDDTVAAAQRVQDLERARTHREKSEQRFSALAIDAENATLGDAGAYRRATQKLLHDDAVEINPELRVRLEESIADDPLKLADARSRDSRRLHWTRIFNSLAASAGRSVFSGIGAIVSFSRSLIGFAVEQHVQDSMDVPQRQALVQWRRFLRENPDALEAPGVAKRVAREERRWNLMQRDHALKLAHRALEQRQPGVALLMSQRALRFVPEDRDALQISEEAQAELAQQRRDLERSLEAPTHADVAPADGRALAVALLSPQGDIQGAAHELLAREPSGPLADEARFSLAIVEGEQGHERTMWRSLETLGAEPPHVSSMARHANALTQSAEQNPYGAFRVARSRDRRDRFSWVVFGPLGHGARHRELPRAVEWLIELPSYFDMIISMPNRLVRYPWLDPWPFGRAPAVFARRYLAHEPNGEHAAEVADWLRDFEKKRGNAVAAFELALQSDTDSKQLAKLRERAALQALEAAKRETRPDLRAALLRRTAREFQETQAGQQAGELARSEAENLTPQRIRISRGFLEENPAVAGGEGLALRSEFLDGDVRNGELHPQGVVLAGGRVLELCYVSDSGDPDDPPLTQREMVSEERIARTVSLLEETALRNARIDRDDAFAPDARRDLFFERARFGIEENDPRPMAASSYAFLGMRERHGLVRSRESILPFELVFQGSLPELSFGAFPRLRPPKPTPDAMLYR